VEERGLKSLLDAGFTLIPRRCLSHAFVRSRIDTGERVVSDYIQRYGAPSKHYWVAYRRHPPFWQSPRFDTAEACLLYAEVQGWKD